ncbi:beta-N-acetylhexosaminidase [Candidatus Pseudothioglobus singularis]|nr:beta-N-acetylhexosaminidase [Candidatus Pseudothioglobus singularis]
MNTTGFVMTTSINSDNYFCSSLSNNSDNSIENFRFCFSLLAPSKAIENCSVVKSSGGYTELCHSEELILKPGEQWSFKYAYEESRHKPMNHRWSPQGCFLKKDNGDLINLEMIDLDLERISSVAPIPNFSGDKLNYESFRLVPHPYSWNPSAGVCNLCSPINVAFENLKIITSAYQSALELGNRLNLNLLSNSTNEINKKATTSLKLTFQDLSEDSAYKITITSDDVEIVSGDESGFYYALVSLMQLSHNYHQLVPCGSIFDKPRFSWRGQHLDTVRHFFSVDSLFKLLDLMSLFKLNKFHWHGVDDEAFRFKLDSYPEAATETSKRGNNLLVPPVFGSGSDATGGYYDKEDIDRIISRASANYIEVIPEFDLPGHNMALINLYPEMRDPEDKSNEVSVQGYRENTLNPAMPQTNRVVESLIDDMCNLFPGEYIHLGGDEIAPGAWEQSPKVQALMNEHDLKNTKDVASWFINKLSKRVELNNKKTASWQEAEDGNHYDDKSDKLLFSWQNLESGFDLARQGYKVVLCPAEHIYFDMAQSRNYADRGANWAAVIPFESTVDWQIIPEDEPELEANIQGIQGHLWCETILEDSEMESMLCPRVIGLSESAWTSNENRRKGTDLHNLATNSFRELFDRIGWDYYIAEKFDIMSDPAKNEEVLASE